MSGSTWLLLLALLFALHKALAIPHVHVSHDQAMKQSIRCQIHNGHLKLCKLSSQQHAYIADAVNNLQAAGDPLADAYRR